MNIKGINETIKNINRKFLYAATAAAVLVVFGIAGLTFGKARHEQTTLKDDMPVPVTTVTIQPKSIDSVVSAAGALTSKNTSVISSKVMGRVTSLVVKEGDNVTVGKLLVRIDSGEIAAQAYQAQAAYNNAKLQYDRIKRLFDENAATQMEMDQATLGLESAKAGLNAAKAMESYTTITAPITGQIVEKKINPGEMALPGQPILKIEDNRNLRLEVTMKEQDIRFVQSGKPVSVRIDALPGKEINGRVAQVVPSADMRTHSFIVKIDIPSDKGLITGMYGKALFTTGNREAVLVPRSALVEMAGLKGVYIVSPEGNAVFQMIQMGEEQGDQVEAVTGIKAGDRVVVNGQNAMIDGRKVVVAQK
jgi:RND family efflux transporter MFP subunit